MKTITSITKKKKSRKNEKKKKKKRSQHVGNKEEKMKGRNKKPTHRRLENEF